MTQIRLSAANLTSPCNTLRTMNSLARSDTSVVIDSEPHQSRTCKTSLLFAPLAVCVHTGCSAFPFYILTKPLILLHIQYKAINIFFYILDIYISNKFNFWSVHGIMNTLGLLQSKCEALFGLHLLCTPTQYKRTVLQPLKLILNIHRIIRGYSGYS